MNLSNIYKKSKGEEEEEEENERRRKGIFIGLNNFTNYLERGKRRYEEDQDFANEEFFYSW
jgi:hypothetical protein